MKKPQGHHCRCFASLLFILIFSENKNRPSKQVHAQSQKQKQVRSISPMHPKTNNKDTGTTFFKK